MNSIYLCFKYVKYDYFFEVTLDTRLTFKENFTLLNNILKETVDEEEMVIYDPKKNIALDNNICLGNFNLSNGQFFLVY